MNVSVILHAAYLESVCDHERMPIFKILEKNMTTPTPSGWKWDWYAIILLLDGLNNRISVSSLFFIVIFTRKAIFQWINNDWGLFHYIMTKKKESPTPNRWNTQNKKNIFKRCFLNSMIFQMGLICDYRQSSPQTNEWFGYFRHFEFVLKFHRLYVVLRP